MKSIFGFFDRIKREQMAVMQAVLLIIRANENPSSFVKLSQNEVIRTLSRGYGGDNPALFISKSENMSYLEMTSVLRNCSNFDKRNFAETLSYAFLQTGKSPKSQTVLMEIARDSDIPMNYIKL